MALLVLKYFLELPMSMWMQQCCTKIHACMGFDAATLCQAVAMFLPIERLDHLSYFLHFYSILNFHCNKAPGHCLIYFWKQNCCSRHWGLPKLAVFVERWDRLRNEGWVRLINWLTWISMYFYYARNMSSGSKYSKSSTLHLSSNSTLWWELSDGERQEGYFTEFRKFCSSFASDNASERPKLRLVDATFLVLCATLSFLLVAFMCKAWTHHTVVNLFLGTSYHFKVQLI